METQETQDFEVHLDLYEGPLALLIHLIEKNNMNIFDISISAITAEYLQYIELMRTMDVQVAGDFLVTATTLMQIKTRLLLPRAPSESPEADPRQELVSKLLLYKKFAQAAQELAQKARAMESFYFRPSPVFEEEEFTVVQNTFDLFGSFRKALEEYDATHAPSHAIRIDPNPIEAKIEKIIKLIQERGNFPIEVVFENETTRHGLVACFLAILELIKRGMITALQKAPFGEIYLARVPVN